MSSKNSYVFFKYCSQIIFERSFVEVGQGSNNLVKCKSMESGRDRVDARVSLDVVLVISCCKW